MGSAALFDLFALKTKENRADQAVPLFPRARRAISCDSSVRRSAQDDGFVGTWERQDWERQDRERQDKERHDRQDGH